MPILPTSLFGFRNKSVDHATETAPSHTARLGNVGIARTPTLMERTGSHMSYRLSLLVFLSILASSELLSAAAKCYVGGGESGGICCISYCCPNGCTSQCGPCGYAGIGGTNASFRGCAARISSTSAKRAIELDDKIEMLHPSRRGATVKPASLKHSQHVEQ